MEIVELGVFQGRTALQLAWGAEQGNGNHVTAIDPWDLAGNVYDPPFTDAGSRVQAFLNIDSLGYDHKINLVQAFSQDIAEIWAESENPAVGLLYVDGDHTEEGARRDIVAWAPHLAPGAVIAVDDYGHPDWPGVGRAVDALVAEGFLAPIELYHDRLAVTRLVVTPDWENGDNDPEDGPTITAITSEGVSPSPYPAAAGQVAVALNEQRQMVDGPHLPDAVDLLFDGPDAEVSTYGHHGNLTKVGLGEALVIEATTGQPIGELNLVNLKALAKHRGIVLGARKDKRDLILQALRDGK
jgi:hypothetical protein